MRRALLLLTANEQAIFSERAATEGVHKTRPHPTGASLLGWAARKLYAKLDDDKARFNLFHSGHVRFSDALPLGRDGRAAFPMPKILVEAKDGAKAVEWGKLVAEQAWVGRNAFYRDPVNANGAFQAEALKGGFVTASLEAPDPSVGGRLRTATMDGRAATGQLFGYSHIEPIESKSGNKQTIDPLLRYVATIEADDDCCSNNVWTALRQSFESEPLRLGRAAATGYGGWYKCEWYDDKFVNPWPAASKPTGTSDKEGTVVRVWLLSDLCLLDDNGAPSLAPPSELLGLPTGGKLDGTESATTTRRFAPWNGHLNKRDVERAVIDAGSVLTYRYRNGIPADAVNTSAIVGLYREQGLGRVWVDPPMLRGDLPQPDPAVQPAVTIGAPAPTTASPAAESPFAKWAVRMAALANAEQRDELLADWTNELDRLLARADKDGPSPSQWHEVATRARGAANPGALIETLFGPRNPVCGSEQASTRGGDWLLPLRFQPETADKKATVRQWLLERIEKAQRAELPLQHVKWALDQLARHAAANAAKRRGREPREAANG